MRVKLFAAILALAAALAPVARAELVITGRDAQKLQCAGLMMAAMVVLEANGQLSSQSRERGSAAVAMIMSGLPGNERQRAEAVRQRTKRIIETREAKQFIQEFNSTTKWCIRNAVD